MYEDDPDFTNFRSEHALSVQKAVFQFIPLYKFVYCSKCRSVSCLGKLECQQQAEEEGGAAEPEPLDCPKCVECPIHGNLGRLQKCMMCCSVDCAFQCGDRFFCEPCHHDMKAKPCLGPDQCPLKGKHSPNGTFNEGCFLCETQSKPLSQDEIAGWKTLNEAAKRGPFNHLNANPFEPPALPRNLYHMGVDDPERFRVIVRRRKPFPHLAQPQAQPQVVGVNVGQMFRGEITLDEGELPPKAKIDAPFLQVPFRPLDKPLGPVPARDPLPLRIPGPALPPAPAHFGAMLGKYLAPPPLLRIPEADQERFNAAQGATVAPRRAPVFDQVNRTEEKRNRTNLFTLPPSPPRPPLFFDPFDLTLPEDEDKYFLFDLPPKIFGENSPESQIVPKNTKDKSSVPMIILDSPDQSPSDQNPD